MRLQGCRVGAGACWSLVFGQEEGEDSAAGEGAVVGQRMTNGRVRSLWFGRLPEGLLAVHSGRATAHPRRAVRSAEWWRVASGGCANQRG